MSAGHALPPPFLLPSRHLLPAICPSLLDHAQDAPPALEPTKDAPTAEAEEELLPILFVLNGGVQVTKMHGPLLTLPLRSESSSVLNRSSSCYGRTAGEDAKMRTEERGLHIRMKMHHPWCHEMDAVAATGDSSMALNRRSRRCPSIGQICGNWRNMKQQR